MKGLATLDHTLSYNTLPYLPSTMQYGCALCSFPKLQQGVYKTRYVYTGR